VPKRIIEYTTDETLQVKDDAATGSQFAQTVTVAKDGGDFTSVKDAIASITDASSAKPYTILVYPGVYMEDPMTLKQYVALEGVGLGAVIIMPTNNASPLFTFASNTSIRSAFLYGPTGDSTCYIAGGAAQCQIENVFFSCASLSSNIAVRATGSGSSVIVEECKTFTNVSVGLQADASGRIDCSNVLQYAATAFFANSGTIWVHNSGGQYNTNGLYADGSGIIYPHNVTLENVTYGVRIGSSGASAEIAGDAVACRGSSTYDVYQQVAGRIDISSATFRLERISAVDWGELHLDFTTEEAATGLDAAIIANELRVGVPEVGRQSDIGRGGPYTRGVVVFTTAQVAGASGGSGPSLADKSTAAASLTGSTFSFQGTGPSYSILFGSELSTVSDVVRHWGLSIVQARAAVEKVKRSFAFEYWDGSAWTEMGVLDYQPENSYVYANEVFIRANSIEDIEYGIEDAAPWAKRSIGGKNLYWSRVRITDGLTTTPSFQQIKLSPSHVSWNENGSVRMHGRARFRQTMQNAGNVFGESGGVLGATVPVGSGGIPTGWSQYIKNSGMNNDGDAIYWQTTLPRGIDTSFPLTVQIVYVPATTAPSGVTFICSAIPVEVAGVYEASPTGNVVPVPRSVTNTESRVGKVGTAVTKVNALQNSLKFHLATFPGYDISNYYEGDLFLCRLETEELNGGSLVVMVAEILGVMSTLGERT
jgi:hypothetical protein